MQSILSNPGIVSVSGTGLNEAGYGKGKVEI